MEVKIKSEPESSLSSFPSPSPSCSANSPQLINSEDNLYQRQNIVESGNLTTTTHNRVLNDKSLNRGASKSNGSKLKNVKLPTVKNTQNRTAAASTIGIDSDRSRVYVVWKRRAGPIKKENIAITKRRFKYTILPRTDRAKDNPINPNSKNKMPSPKRVVVTKKVTTRKTEQKGLAKKPLLKATMPKQQGDVAKKTYFDVYLEFLRTYNKFSGASVKCKECIVTTV